MLELFTGYKRYPYKVPIKVKITNVVRYFFKLTFLENILVSKLNKEQSDWWSRLIPPAYFFRPGSFRTVKRDGLYYRLDLSIFLDHAIFFCRMKEDAGLNSLFKILEPHFVVLDVGANNGYLTLNFARACTSGFVYSFEPDSKNFESLRINIELNNLKNIKIFKKALGARESTEILYKYYQWNPGTNRILSEKPDLEHQFEHIEVTRLDQLAESEQFQKIHVIKVDVEGYEKFVLEGAKNLIEKFRPILFVELVEYNLNQQGYSCLSLIEYIEAMGYEVKDAKTMRPVDRIVKNHNTDILCFSLV